MRLELERLSDKMVANKSNVAAPLEAACHVAQEMDGSLMRPHDTPADNGWDPIANAREQAFRELVESKGWKPSKRGWPDFLCFGPDGKVIVVEIKPRRRNGELQPLRRDQIVVMAWLQSLGVPCYLSDGKSLEPFNAAKEGERRGERDFRLAELRQKRAAI